jgi:signal transduction histidine kinase
LQQSTTGNADRFSEHGFTIPNPVHLPALNGVTQALQGITTFVLVVGLFAGVASIIVRLRRARGVERQQVRWLTYTAAGGLALVPLPFLAGALHNNQVLFGIFWFGVTLVLVLGIPVASAIAISKYRLYDLDIVLKRTVVAGALVVFGTLVYLGVVLGIGAAIGNRGNAALTLAAAAIVAIAFQPLRARARHLADRLVYGKRATPYEVLSEFSDRVAVSYSTDDVLPRMAKLLAEGTGARSSGVWLRLGSEVRLAASWPASNGEGSGTDTASADDLERLPGGDRTFPVRHLGEVLGALTVAMPPAEPLTPSQEKLIQDLAAQAGLVLRNVRLIEELRASRQRLVAAQDQERRRLERNLHDGAQQQLVALSVKQRLVETLMDRDPGRAKELLATLQADTVDALDTLRDLARGIYPPLLADQGLAAALSAQARKGGPSRGGVRRRHRPVPAGSRSRRVLLLPGGAPEHREVRRRVAGVGPVAGRRRRAGVRGPGRRCGVRPGRHPDGLGAAEHGPPARCAGRFGRRPIEARVRHDRHRPNSRHRLTPSGRRR